MEMAQVAIHSRPTDLRQVDRIVQIHNIGNNRWVVNLLPNKAPQGIHTKRTSAFRYIVNFVTYFNALSVIDNEI